VGPFRLEGEDERSQKDVLGIEARGKTHVTHSLLRYLHWLGVKAEGELDFGQLVCTRLACLSRATAFSLGDHRRTILGSASDLPKDYFYTMGQRSPETEDIRRRVKNSLEDEIVRYFFEKSGQVRRLVFSIHISGANGTH
jgi:6-phosphofructo-2-kinase / fructose-2,6-biphosphatase 4